jgi:serine protease Do
VKVVASIILYLTLATALRADETPFEAAIRTANMRVVKIFGSGGFKELISYGSGILISPKGHILTAATQLLDTQDLRIHTYDGRKFRAKVLAVESSLDMALLEIRLEEGKTLPTFPYFDLQTNLEQTKPKLGDFVLAFTNAFQIATRDEPVSVQRGTIASIAKLQARRGINEAPFSGDVYFLDTVINNPGAAGGALTSRDGKLIGMIGKEYRSIASDTWANYAIPISTKVQVTDADGTREVSLIDFVTKGMKGEWKTTKRDRTKSAGVGGYHGIIFVPNVLERTPAYVEAVRPGSPAAKAGVKADDLLIYFDGEPVYNLTVFQDLISRTRPGTTVKIEVRRKDRLTSLELQLTDYPKP